MSKENMLGKYNVTVSPVVAKIINQDLIEFNLKSRNAIYNQIIIRTYEFYKSNRNRQINTIIKVLNDNGIDSEKVESIAIHLVDNKYLNDNKINTIKQKKEVLPVKVNANAKRIIEIILNGIDDDRVVINNSKHELVGTNNDSKSVSECLRQLFTFYASLTTCEREMLLFAEKVNIVLEAIHNNVTIDMVGIKENINFRFKPITITTNEANQNAFVVGIAEFLDVSIANRYQLYSIKINELANFRTRKERQDLCFDKEYVLGKYKAVVDDEFNDIFNKFNMIIDLASKYEFKCDNDGYVLKVTKMNKKDSEYYKKKYNYNGEKVVIPYRFMNTIISIPVKLNFMLHHDPGYAYTIEESGLVKVKYNEIDLINGSNYVFNRLQTVREVTGNEVVYETTIKQAEAYFKGLSGFTIIYPQELKDALVSWHKKIIEEL